MRCGLVDELGSKDDGGHHARHEADSSDDDIPSDVDHYDDDGDGCDDDGDVEDCGPNDDLQVGEVQVTSTKVAAHTEEDETKGKDEHTNSNNKVDCNHPHLSCLSSGGVVVPRETLLFFIFSVAHPSNCFLVKKVLGTKFINLPAGHGSLAFPDTGVSHFGIVPEFKLLLLQKGVQNCGMGNLIHQMPD